MIIKEVSLTNFRNHTNYHLECEPNTTLILGSNGWGKTSILEAIYILTQGKSFRATDPDILKRDADFYRIEAVFDDGELITATFDGNIKNFTLLGKKHRRLPIKNKYPIVLFEPRDLNLISGSPSRHREYFDRIFGNLNPSYSTTLHRYEKALHQRNELLKNEADESALFSWNLLLARYGTLLSSTRAEFTKIINDSLDKTYHSIAENDDYIELKYITSVGNFSESEYLKELESSTKKDTYLGHTSFGIHRDDFEFYFNHKPADGSASRGETRSIILALKFVEAKIIEDKLQKRPIILLDDVFSELDESRRKALVNNFKNHQVIITSVEKINY